MKVFSKTHTDGASTGRQKTKSNIKQPLLKLQIHNSPNLNEIVEKYIKPQAKQLLVVSRGGNRFIYFQSEPLKEFLGNSDFTGKATQDFHNFLAKNISDSRKGYVEHYLKLLDRLEGNDKIPTAKIYVPILQEDALVYYEISISYQDIDCNSFEAEELKTSLITLFPKRIDKKTYDVKEKSDMLFSPTVEEIGHKVKTHTENLLTRFNVFRKSSKKDLEKLGKEDLKKLYKLYKSAQEIVSDTQDRIKKVLEIDASEATVFLQVWSPTTRDESNQIIHKPHTYLRARWRDGKTTRTKYVESIAQNEEGLKEKEEWMSIISNEPAPTSK